MRSNGIMGHMTSYCRKDRTTEGARPNQSIDSKNTDVQIQRITDQRKSGIIYNKLVQVNGKTKSAFIDFGSQCTVIKDSVVNELKIQVYDDNLPCIKGFTFGKMQPIGKVDIDLTLDFIKVNVQAYVVPDEFLSTDILVGQNVTELQDIVVFKTSSCLVLYSDKSEANKINIHVMDDISINGMQAIKVRCDENYTGHIYIPGSTSFKIGEEIMILPGVYYVEDGISHIPVISFVGGALVRSL
ncbi:hypothetical protein JYU34_002574 [Plutella xylostella]|uniref:Uncharacterized protein n=1 Tax=Plutella xylostella TaxID=51655 RepID=A0ABQ7R2J9_PLUXY|nr:hypothetical protein JYU34_002574 [Plutella xylostella]